MTESEANRRTDHRVGVPENYVREIALWFCADNEPLRLSLEELGRPHLRLSKLGSGRMVLSDVSVRGLGLTLALPQQVVEGLLAAKAMHVYLQLWDPSADAPGGLLSIFAFCHLVRVAPGTDGLFLGARFKRFAIPSKHDKSMDFLDATRCGINDLARWCDNLDRGVLFETHLASGGLDMDNLLAEVENTLAGQATDAADPDSPENP